MPSAPATQLMSGEIKSTEENEPPDDGAVATGIGEATPVAVIKTAEDDGWFLFEPPDEHPAPSSRSKATNGVFWMAFILPVNHVWLPAT